MSENKILVVEDEKELADILGAYLEVEGFCPIIKNDEQAGIDAFRNEDPQLVLLDIMLPNIDGITVCKEIRKCSDIPVIMISAKSGEMDKVVALGIGADDYVTKPFSPLELMARVKAQLRRYYGNIKKVEGEQQILSFGNLSINSNTYQVSYNDNEIEFTTKEFEILLFMAKNSGQVFSKTQIYQQVWGYDNVSDDNSITVYINRIREKLEISGNQYIKTVWGAGYKFVDEGQ